MSKDLNDKIDFGASVPEVKSHEQLVKVIIVIINIDFCCCCFCYFCSLLNLMFVILR